MTTPLSKLIPDEDIERTIRGFGSNAAYHAFKHRRTGFTSSVVLSKLGEAMMKPETKVSLCTNEDRYILNLAKGYLDKLAFKYFEFVCDKGIWYIEYKIFKDVNLEP